MKACKTRAQIALEFLLVMTAFYLLLAWPMNYYLSMRDSGIPEEKQLEGIARGLGMLANRLCVSTPSDYNSSANLTYSMPCFYYSGNSTNYSVVANGYAINVSSGNVTVVKSALCYVNSSFNASCGVTACISSYNANVSIGLGGC